MFQLPRDIEFQEADVSLATCAVQFCFACGSSNLSQLRAEVALHIPGLKNIDKPTLFVFPDVRVCLDCGKACFTVPEIKRLTLGFLC